MIKNNFQYFLVILSLGLKKPPKQCHQITVRFSLNILQSNILGYTIHINSMKVLHTEIFTLKA